LVAQAQASGVPAPVNQAVVELIRGLEDSWTR
jgi:ketopantoate reductase